MIATIVKLIFTAAAVLIIFGVSINGGEVENSSRFYEIVFCLLSVAGIISAIQDRNK